MPQRFPFWRQTPPAIFPVTLGFMGLGLAWRNASQILGISHEIGDLLLGVSTAYMVWFLSLYFLKALSRPSVVFEDLRIPPNRAGVASVPMSVMLLAAALLPFNVHVPEVWWVGVVLQFLAITLVTIVILRDPPEMRAFSPFQYLSYVGPVVAPIAGIPLGFATESLWLAFFALAAFVVITIGYAAKLIRVRPPVPLRPSLAIILAPSGLLALTFAQQDWPVLFLIFYALSWLIALTLLFAARWLIAGGWTPMWGSFTFPIAVFTNMQVEAANHGMERVAIIGIWLGLSIGTPLILFIVYKATMAWIQGDLAKKTGAVMA